MPVRNPISAYAEPAHQARNSGRAEQHVRSFSVASHPHDLAPVLPENDPLFVLFCLYLSSRIDLLRVEERQLLAGIRDSGKPLSFATVADDVAVQLGFPPDRMFPHIAETPLDSRILYNEYAAIIAGGERVCVRVLRPGIAEVFHLRLENFGQEAARVFPKTWADCLSRQVVTDFHHALKTQLDCLCEAENADSLYHSAQKRTGLWAPKVYRNMCRPGLLTTERPDGFRLSQMARFGTGPDRGLIADQQAPRLSRDELAKSFLREWLQLAVSGSRIPTWQTLNDLVVLADGRVGWVGGSFATIPESARKRIWCYLAAAASDDPDLCCRELANLMHASKAPSSEEDLLSSFRQIATFRHLEDDALHSELTLRILRQLQVMLSHGYRPAMALVQFYRGLFSILALVRQIYPGADPLPEAVDETWVTMVFEPIRGASRPDALAAMFIKCTASMLALPGEVDRYLNAQPETHFEAGSGYTPRSPSDRFLPALLVAAVILILGKSSAFHVPTFLSGKVGFALCCVIASLLIYFVKSD